MKYFMKLLRMLTHRHKYTVLTMYPPRPEYKKETWGFLLRCDCGHKKLTKLPDSIKFVEDVIYSYEQSPMVNITKEPRPRIPKLTITNIGIVDKDGAAKYWAFDGKSNPKSVGEYISEHWHLIGGYTIDELREISKKRNVDE